MRTKISAPLMFVKSTIKTLDKAQSKRGKSRPEAPSGYSPKTLLGKKLWALRQKYMAEGGKLMNWAELDREIASRKGQAQ